VPLKVTNGTETADALRVGRSRASAPSSEVIEDDDSVIVHRSKTFCPLVEDPEAELP
jgi:hypothetical protein